MQFKVGGGNYVEVDHTDSEYLSGFTWSAHGNGYAFRREHLGGNKYAKIYMHRELAGAKKGEYVDHINTIKSDNRKENLRICTNAQNARNQPKRKGSSIYKGVYYDKTRNKWVSQITVNYKNIYLGGFSHERDAGLAYDKAALKYFEDFALTNGLKESEVPAIAQD